MRTTRLAALLTAFGLVAWAASAQAELYKWVDEKGVVNYGDAPPANARKPVALDEAKSSLSVVPGLGKEELARLETRAEQARADRLERENADLRARLASPPPAPAPRVDEPVAVVPVYVPQVVRRPHTEPRRPPVRARPVDKTVPPPAAMRLER